MVENQVLDRKISVLNYKDRKDFWDSNRSMKSSPYRRFDELTQEQDELVKFPSSWVSINKFRYADENRLNSLEMLKDKEFEEMYNELVSKGDLEPICDCPNCNKGEMLINTADDDYFDCDSNKLEPDRFCSNCGFIIEGDDSE